MVCSADEPLVLFYREMDVHLVLGVARTWAIDSFLMLR